MRVDAEKIKKLREKKGLSQIDLAIEIGYESRSPIQRLENDGIGLKEPYFAKLAQVFDCWVEDLLIAEPGDYE